MNDISVFLLNGANLPFIVSGCVLAAILLIEIVGLLLGISSFFHHDVDVTLDLNGNGIPDYLEAHDGGLAGWFNPGQVPIMIFLVLFSTIFTVVGLAAQWIYVGATGVFAPMILSIPVVLALTLPVTRAGSIVVAKIMPRDISNAVTLDSLAGDQGWVVLGPITSEVSGSVRVTDQHGVDHYLFAFAEGDQVLEIKDPVVLVGPHPDKFYGHIVRKI